MQRYKYITVFSEIGSTQVQSQSGRACVLTFLARLILRLKRLSLSGKRSEKSSVDCSR